MMKSEKTALLKLLNVSGLGPVRINEILEKYSNPNDVFSDSLKGLAERLGFPEKILQSIKKHHDLDQKVDKQQSFVEKYQMKTIALWEPEYPSLLKEIYAPPPLLFARGNIGILKNKKNMAVVGTRRADSYGLETTAKICGDLVKKGGTVIVSGLAEGIDSAAHKSCLKNEGETIAVVGTGLEVCYPACNRSLMEEIIKKGLMLSEFLPGTKIEPSNFPKRNRIISGLSLGVIVVQAGVKSGALITAGNAVEQNREVFAVPGPITNPRCLGTNKLLKDNGKVTLSADDVFEEFPDVFSNKEDGKKEVVRLNSDELQLIRLLETETFHLSDLSKILEGKIKTDLFSLLLNLELKNLIKKTPGKGYQLTLNDYSIESL